ncbi:heat shock factor protein 5-like isoform X2 [Tachysurus fulvidraco]|uniref:heat shock factor protein 5-like isoform X2 n=1 Tax=Tachysurus fulvidraco TaxID=1234273 RepID=UPI001FEF8836|nr:heat shock factor protein 5-like isoform X2 [Tachysurus fulvidraco]
MEVLINQRNFPNNLWHLVNDPQISSICWDDSGEGILICPEAFKAEVLSADNKQKVKFFRTTNFISFVRQLNLYGFRKVCPDYKISLTAVSFIQHYFNPNFKRANPELLVNLKRHTPSNKAKLAAGKETSNQSSPLHPMMKSPDISAVVDLSEHQGTSDHLHVNGSHTTPQSSQAFVTGHDDSSSEFCHLQVDFLSTHLSSPMQQGLHCAVPDGNFDASMPDLAPCSFNAPVNQCCISDVQDSSYSHLLFTGQDPNCQSADVQDSSYSHLLFTDQDPNCQSADVQDSSYSQVLFTGQDPNCQSADFQDSSYSHLLFTGQDPNCQSADVQDYLYSELLFTGQDPNWQSADAPDPRKSHINLDTIFDAEDEMKK